MKQVVVTGSFDDLRSRRVRLLQEAARWGRVHALLWSDDMVIAQTGSLPKFLEAERRYFVNALRYVHQVKLIPGIVDPDAIPQVHGLHPAVWVVPGDEDNARKRAMCAAQGIEYVTLSDRRLAGFPIADEEGLPSSSRRVVVTGCYDWLHSGHVRFFEETSAWGDLHVVVGSDANVNLLKGEGHPLFSAQERRYMVQAVRFVSSAYISSGSGWMDAVPEIARIQPHLYAVNQDGDVPEKRAFCAAHGIEYVVLKRAPKRGLPPRESSILRGF